MNTGWPQRSYAVMCGGYSKLLGTVYNDCWNVIWQPLRWYGWLTGIHYGKQRS